VEHNNRVSPGPLEFRWKYRIRQVVGVMIEKDPCDVIAELVDKTRSVDSCTNNTTVLAYGVKYERFLHWKGRG
jgi:hypothetical protein